MENNGSRSDAFANKQNATSQNITDARTQQPLVAPNQSDAPSDYQIRLLNLYAQRVAETGEVDYPPLQEYLQQVYQVATAPRKCSSTGSAPALLLPETVEKLVANMQAAVEDVEIAIAEIGGVCDRALLLHQEGSLSPPQKSELRTAACQATARTLQASTYLLELANAHFPDAESKMRSHSQKQDSEESQQNMLVVKLKNDLRYFCQYLQERTATAVILDELHWELRPQAYFRRLQEYLALIPGVAASLANLLQKTLEAKIPSNSTTQPRSYR